MKALLTAEHRAEELPAPHLATDGLSVVGRRYVVLEQPHEGLTGLNPTDCCNSAVIRGQMLWATGLSRQVTIRGKERPLSHCMSASIISVTFYHRPEKP